MSTTKTFNNIKAGKRHQIDATARGYYDFRTTVVPQPNKSLSYDMKVYDGLNYVVDLSKNSVRPGEINFDGTVLPYLENNTLTKTNYCFGNSGTNYDLPIYEDVYSNITKVGNVVINNGIASNFSASDYLDLGNFDFSGDYEIVLKFKMPETDSDTTTFKPFFDSKNKTYFNIAVTSYKDDNKRRIHSNSGDGSSWHTDIQGNTPLELNTEYYVKVVRSGTTRTMYLSTDNVTWSTEGSVEDTYDYSSGYCLGAASYMGSIEIFKGTIDLKESKITIGENIINLGDTTLFPKYDLTFNANGSASYIKGSSLVGISGNVTIQNIKLNPTDKIKISYKYESGYNEIMKLGPLYLTATWVRNSGILPYLYYKTSESETSFSTYKQLGSSLVKDQWYNVEITMIDLNNLKVGFSIGENNEEYTYFNITDGYFTEGTYECTINGSSCNEINFSGLPGLTQLTESKTGIFQDYEDSGQVKTLNCFSYGNQYTVLTPNENIEGTIKYYKYSYQPFTRPNMTSNIAIGGNEFGVESDIPMLDGNAVYKGFDADMSSYFHSEPDKTVGYFTFYNPNPLKVTSLTFTQQSGYLNRSTSGGTVYGSNDNVNWTKITDFTHSKRLLTWSLDLSMNTEYYKYYKVYSKGVLNGSYYVFADCAITAEEKIITEGTPDDYDEKVGYTWLGMVDIPKHTVYSVDDFYGWSNNSKSIFTKTLQLSTDIPLYNSSYEQQSLMINGTFTTTPVESNGIVSDFNGGLLNLSFTDSNAEIRFYSKVNPSDQNHEHQIMGVEGTLNNIGRDNNVWRLWNGSGHYGSAFDINIDYWVCLVDNRSGTYTMYVLKDNNYTKDTLPELTSWNKEFELSGSFFESTNCFIGGNNYNNTIIENWTGTIDLNNTWFESSNTKLWEGTSELKINSFTDNSITLINNEVYTRNNTLDKHFVLPNSTSGGGRSEST